MTTLSHSTKECPQRSHNPFQNQISKKRYPFLNKEKQPQTAAITQKITQTLPSIQSIKLPAEDIKQTSHSYKGLERKTHLDHAKPISKKRQDKT